MPRIAGSTTRSASHPFTQSLVNGAITRAARSATRIRVRIGQCEKYLRKDVNERPLILAIYRRSRIFISLRGRKFPHPRSAVNRSRIVTDFLIAMNQLNKTEGNYSTVEKELLAIVYSVNFFRPYGRKFILIIDQPLKWLHSVKDPTSRFVRWRLKLADYRVVYKAGRFNVNADALSRNPLPQIFNISSVKLS